MNTSQRLRRRVVAQFHRPTGVGGHLAGLIMGHRPSNVSRNRWAVDLLDLRPSDRVIELGCGPGIALAAMADRITHGVAVGVDHSPVMIRQAGRRNAARVAEGRVLLVRARVEDLLVADGDPTGDVDPGPFAEPFQAALSVNSVGFWEQPKQRLAALRRLMAPAGRVALVSQPRCPGADVEASRAAGDALAELLDDVGFTGITWDLLDLHPPAVCVRAAVAGS
jgi:SAM-dependent methyltransferase